MRSTTIAYLLPPLLLAASCTSRPAAPTAAVDQPDTPTPLVASPTVERTPTTVPTSTPRRTPRPEPTATLSPDEGNLVRHVDYRCSGAPAEEHVVYVFPGTEGEVFARRKLDVNSRGEYQAHLAAGEFRLTASDNHDARAFTFAQERVTLEAGETTLAEDIFLDRCPNLVLLEPADSKS